MSEGSIQVAVITPEGAAFEGQAQTVVVPAFDGEVAFYPGHAPFVGQLGQGEFRVVGADGTEQRFYLESGVVEVHDDQVTVLAEALVPVASLDASTEREALAAALAETAVGDEALDAREAKATAARARLRVAGD